MSTPPPDCPATEGTWADGEVALRKWRAVGTHGSVPGVTITL